MELFADKSVQVCDAMHMCTYTHTCTYTHMHTHLIRVYRFLMSCSIQMPTVEATKARSGSI